MHGQPHIKLIEIYRLFEGTSHVCLQGTVKTEATGYLEGSVDTLQIARRQVARDSSVVIATRYGLDGPGIESRCGRLRRQFPQDWNVFEVRRHHDIEYSRDSSVGIATRYGLDGPGIESRCGRLGRQVAQDWNVFEVRRHHDIEYSRDSSVGIATRYGLDGSGIESRCGRLRRQVAQDWNVFEVRCHHDIEYSCFGPSGNEAGSFSRVFSTTTPHPKGSGIKFEVFYFPQSLQADVSTLRHVTTASFQILSN